MRIKQDHILDRESGCPSSRSRPPGRPKAPAWRRGGAGTKTGGTGKHAAPPVAAGAKNPRPPKEPEAPGPAYRLQSRGLAGGGQPTRPPTGGREAGGEEPGKEGQKGPRGRATKPQPGGARPNKCAPGPGSRRAKGRTCGPQCAKRTAARQSGTTARRRYNASALAIRAMWARTPSALPSQPLAAVFFSCACGAAEKRAVAVWASGPTCSVL